MYIGTPEILAPELFLEHGYGYSVDWWGLGALFSEMLLGDAAIISQVHIYIYTYVNMYICTYIHTHLTGTVFRGGF